MIKGNEGGIGASFRDDGVRALDYVVEVLGIVKNFEIG